MDSSTKYYVKDCIIEKGQGTCNFLEKTYFVRQTGCHNNVTVTFSRNEVTEEFTQNDGSLRWLSDGALVRINGAPCSVATLNLGFMIPTQKEVNSNGTYLLMEGAKINLNNVSAELIEISNAASGDTQPKVRIVANNQICSLHEREACKVIYCSAMRPLSKNLLIFVQRIYLDSENQHRSAAIVSVVKINEPIQRIQPVLEAGAVDIPAQPTQETLTVTAPPKKVQIKDTGTALPKVPQKVVVVQEDSKYSYACEGCLLDNKCYPFGYQKEKAFCS